MENPNLMSYNLDTGEYKPMANDDFDSASNEDFSNALGYRMEQLEKKFDDSNERLDKLTGAVNQFGGMLQNIVDNVSGMSQAIQKGGIGGILSLMKGASSE